MPRLANLLLCALGLGLASAHAKFKVNEPLLACDQLMALRRDNVLHLPHNLYQRLTEYTVTDVRDFGGHKLLRRGAPVHSAQAPDLIFSSKRWRREQWQVEGKDYWFYDVGFKNLEQDAADLNASVLAQIMNRPSDSIWMKASPARRRDLRHLYTYRWAFHRRVMDQYRADWRKQKYLDFAAFERLDEANRLNDNVDVFGILDRPLDWTADEDTIADHVVTTVQISYGKMADHFRPNVIGMLAQLNVELPAPAPLPFMARLPEGRARTNFLAAYDDAFRDQHVCEVARYLKTIKRLDPTLSHRLLYEVFNRARLHGCTVLVASVTDSTARLFERYGFAKFRGLPTGSSTKEYLSYLWVNSPEFIRTYAFLMTTHAWISYFRSDPRWSIDSYRDESGK